MNQKIEKVKNHLCDNKKSYIGVGTGLIVGAVSVYLLKSRPVVMSEIAPVFNNINNNLNTNINTNVNFGGYSHKLVKNDNTNEIWETVKDAAEAAGVTSSKMSRHLNRHMTHINDETYSIIGVGTSG